MSFMKVRKNPNILVNVVALNIQTLLALSWAFVQKAHLKNINQLYKTPQKISTTLIVFFDEILAAHQSKRGHA